MRLKDQLPNDVAKLKKLLLEKEDKIQDLTSVIQGKSYYISELENSNKLLSEQLNLALKYRYARSSEKWTGDDKNQMWLFDEAEMNATSKPNDKTLEKVIIGPYKRKKKKGRKPIEDSIPRNYIKHDLTEEQRRCKKVDCPRFESCAKLRPIIGYDEREELDFIPAKIQVNHHQYYSYGQIACDDFVSDENQKAVIKAEREPRMVPGSIVTPSLLSQIVVSKFSDALPLNRQERILGRIGIQISRQTMCNWIIRASEKVEIFLEYLWEKCRGGPLLNVDETTLQVLKEPGKLSSSLSYMWVVIGSNKSERCVIFKYSRNRTKEFAKSLLMGYKGVVQTDGYEGYTEACETKDIWHVGCLAHVRRKFYDAYKASDKEGLSVEALDIIRKIYSIEDQLKQKKLKTEEFKIKRQYAVAPVFREFKQWLIEQKKVVVPNCLLGKAINYALNEYKKVVRYLKYGYITPDNNLAERAIRPFTVGRKNWLFNNTPRGAFASANMYSLVETAKANNLEPYHYLEYIFTHLPYTQTKADLEKLLPWNVKTKIPPHVPIKS